MNRMWEIREGSDYERSDYGNQGDYGNRYGRRYGMKSIEDKVYECGYEDGYEAAMKEIKRSEYGNRSGRY